MAELIFDDEGDLDEMEVDDDAGLTDPCKSLGIPFSCTEGTCKTCVIEVLEGMENLSDYTEAEKKLLGESIGKQRLACQCKIKQGSVRFTC